MLLLWCILPIKTSVQPDVRCDIELYKWKTDENITSQAAYCLYSWMTDESRENGQLGIIDWIFVFPLHICWYTLEDDELYLSLKMLKGSLIAGQLGILRRPSTWSELRRATLSRMKEEGRRREVRLGEMMHFEKHQWTPRNLIHYSQYFLRC